MIDALLSYIAPHHCYGCGTQGGSLCQNCKYDIISEPYSGCVACGEGLAGVRGTCTICRVPYQRAWCVSDRRDAVERLIDGYKFENNQSAGRIIADLLHAHLPELPQSTRIVPVPTINTHIRQRGYDHMLLVARHLATLRGLACDTSLYRATSTRQRGASAVERRRQAVEAFACSRPLRTEPAYLLLDDVVTTGSTIKYATKALQAAGAKTVWVATFSRQPLD